MKTTFGARGKPRHAFEQHVAAGKQANDYAVDDLLLADDDLGDFATDFIQLGYGLPYGFFCGHDSVFLLYGTTESPKGAGSGQHGNRRARLPATSSGAAISIIFRRSWH